MKLTVLLISLLFAFGAHARLKPEDPVVITDNVTVTQSVKPDIMTSGMSVSYKNQDSFSVSAAMEKAAGIVKSSAPLCVFSGYQIYPVYRYTDKNNIFDGYNGSLDFSCEFTDINKYTKVLNDIFALSSDPSYVITSRPVRWVLSDKAQSEKRIELKTSAIRQIYRTAKDYGKTIGIGCRVKDIEMSAYDSAPVYRENVSRTMLKSAAVAEPEQSDVNMSFSAKYRLVCR